MISGGHPRECAQCRISHPDRIPALFSVDRSNPLETSWICVHPRSKVLNKARLVRRDVLPNTPHHTINPWSRKIPNARHGRQEYIVASRLPNSARHSSKRFGVPRRVHHETSLWSCSSSLEQNVLLGARTTLQRNALRFDLSKLVGLSHSIVPRLDILNFGPSLCCDRSSRYATKHGCGGQREHEK